MILISIQVQKNPRYCYNLTYHHESQVRFSTSGWPVLKCNKYNGGCTVFFHEHDLSYSFFQDLGTNIGFLCLAFGFLVIFVPKYPWYPPVRRREMCGPDHFPRLCK